MRTSLRFTGWLGLFLASVLAACGTQNIGTMGPGQVQDQRNAAGVTLGGFEVIRYNEAGFADSALNSTLALRLEQQAGGQALVISVNDTLYTGTVAVDVRYDPDTIHPDSVDFHGLLGSSDRVLSASFLGTPGRAGIGETGLRGYRPAALSGDFATVIFVTGAMRGASAINSAHGNPDGVGDPDVGGQPNLVGAFDVANQTASVRWFAGWHTADGDQNGEVNIADITPIGIKFAASTGTDWSAVPSDYDGNSEVNIADITPIGVNFNTGTNSYRVEAADNATAARTPVATLAWPDAATAVPPPTAPDLGSIFKSWTVDFSGTSAFTYASLAAVDTGDNLVTVFITPVATTPSGDEDAAEASVELQVGSPTPQPANLTITGYSIKVAGATGGTGATTDIFGDGSDAGAVMANSAITVNLEAIFGNWSSDAGTGGFGPGNLPADMESGDYDIALAAARAAMVYTVNNGGDAAARRSADWATFASGPSPITGDPLAGTIFPDDDPESDSNSPEGLLDCRLPPESEVTYPTDTALEVRVLAAITANFEFDVTLDPAAATPDGYFSEPTLQGQFSSFILNQNNFVFIPITWGSGGAPADLTTTEAELLQFGTNTLPSAVATTTISLTNAPTGANTFEIFANPDTTYTMRATVSGLTLTPDGLYGFRIKPEVGPFSSVNKPEALIQTAPAPPAQDLLTVPGRLGPAIDEIQIFYNDPVVRRNGELTIDVINSLATPVDAPAYNDVLKVNGDEFVISVANNQAYPRLCLIEADDPNAIDATTPTTNGVFIIGTPPGGWQPGRLAVDVALLTIPGGVGDPSHTYAYKLFDAFDAPVGQGTFVVSPLDIAFTSPSPVNFGVNVWDREELDIDTEVYDDLVVDGSTIASNTPDVLWVRFADGNIYDWDGSADGTDGNVRIYISDTDGTFATGSFALQLRIGGLGVTSTEVIATHVFSIQDFYEPFQIGPLKAGITYDVALDDPQQPGVPDPGGAFANDLFCSTDPS